MGNLNTQVIRSNLDKILDKNLDDTCLDTLKQLCNYTKENEFKQFKVLIQMLKYSNNDGSADDNAIYCISELLKIKEFLEIFIDNPKLKSPSSTESISIRTYINWFLESRNVKKLETRALTLKEFKVRTPLKLSGKIIEDWLELDENRELRHYVAKLTN